MPRESSEPARSRLLLEIGTEEIPAGFLAAALGDIEREAAARLAAARLGAESVQSLGTPRRLAFIAEAVPARQPDLSERIVGPPARIAFDAAGKPTQAAIGFAKKNQIELSAIEKSTVEGKDGEYAVCTRLSAGGSALEVLPGLLADLVRDLPWPKSMRWGWSDFEFVRPIHWIVALLGEEVIGFDFAGVRSGRTTRGHRFLSPRTIDLSSPDDYIKLLREAHVVADPRQRRTMIAAELARIETDAGASVRPDPALIDEVANLVEYPVAVCGSFDRAFLEVPEPVVISAMRSHQRYFAMTGPDGALVNRFVTIAGTITRDQSHVRAGNERVLAARLSDARFFFTEDRKQSLDAHAAKLAGVVFQAKLGTIQDKVNRLVAFAPELARDVGADVAFARRAAQICKADLVTRMVHEFPDLQGVIGRYYAELAGEPREVAAACGEHYMPRGSGDALPGTAVGAVLGIADRMDTLVGCFAVGLAPTGSADPYGLRRAAVGVLSILLGRGWKISVRELIDRAAANLAGKVAVTDAIKAQVAEFVAVRLKGLLVGLPADCVDAALAAGADDVPDARARAEAVARLRTRADFEPLAAAFKRVANILKGETITAAPDPDRFVDDNERALWSAFTEIERRVAGHLGDGDYNAGLGVLAELKVPVDKFFDSVLVMDKDEAIKANRLALLGRINATFTRIADFRQLAV